MPVTDTQLEFIFRYFDGDLSAKEEEQLMQQLQQNVELQQAFDQQVLMQQFQPGEPGAPSISPETESADDFLKRVTGSTGAKPETMTMRPVPVVKRRYTRMAAAAAILVGMLAITIYYFNRKGPDNPVVKLPGKDSITQLKQPGQKQLQNDTVSAPAENLQQLYTDNYEIFSRDELKDIPPAAMVYESEYKRGEYGKLAKESESVLGMKGSDDPQEEEKVANYFNFYKALANIEIRNTVMAEALLHDLLAGNARKTELRNHLKWYLLLVYLNNNKKSDALRMADLLTKDKKNPYYQKAVVIKKRLAVSIISQ